MSERKVKQRTLRNYFQIPAQQHEQDGPSTSSIPEEEPTEETFRSEEIRPEPSTTSSSVELDIGNFDRASVVDDQTKYDFLTQHWKPNKNYIFPKNERRVAGKTQRLSFQHQWLETFKWLAYSPSQEGAFCKNCVLFAPKEAGGARLKQFVTSPMTNLKDAKSLFANHAKKTYHLTATLMAENFRKSHTSANVIEQMSAVRSRQALANQRALSSILDTIKLCGRQNIPLRGHRDSGVLKNPTNFETDTNEGNFRALLRFRISSGDADLLDHAQSSPRNALYTSWDIQNELISVCGDEIRGKLVENVKQAKFFSVLADETTDVDRMEQFSICVRYVFIKEDGSGILREDFLGFVEANDLTGQALSESLLQSLQSWGLDLDGLIGQGYDGAANMSGRFKGVQALVKEKFPKACYTHCNSHCLNLALSHACGDASMKKTVRSIQDVITFFTDSPKRQRYLKDAILSLVPDSRRTRLRSLCETRWVERHDAVIAFTELYSAVVHTLGEMEGLPDTSAADKAESFKYRIRTMQFVCNLKILENVLGLTFQLSVALQSQTIDIVACSSMIKEVRNVLQASLENSEREFSKIFEQISAMLHSQQIPLTRRELRSTDEEDLNTEAFLRENRYEPFLRKIIEEIDERFDSTFKQAAACFGLIPFNIRRSGTSGITEETFQLYSDELDVWPILRGELLLWGQKWLHSGILSDLPRNALESFNSAPAELFPNIRKILQILATLPVTTASAERSFSQMRRLKTYLRNTTKEERLNGLALLQLHREIEVPNQKVIREFAAKKARRLNIAL